MKHRNNNSGDSPLDEHLLLDILDNTFGNIYVTDKEGKVLFANYNTAKVFGMNRDDILKTTSQELVKKGVISKSTSLEAIEKKEVVISRIRTQAGYSLVNFSKPIFDNNGEVSIVMTFGQQENLMGEFLQEIEKEKEKTEKYKEALSRLSGLNKGCGEPILEDEKMKTLYGQLEKVAFSNGTILLLGESGTGKDVASNYIHQCSLRRSEPFIAINCATIPEELMESEFFGYSKGAFTGADANGRTGIFEMAHKGTLFLDEIGELPLNIQAKFLRVLETGEITKLGSHKTIKTDVRIIVATNKDLRQGIAEKTFREDLYYRLNVLSFEIPPLRERPADIPKMINYFLKFFNKKYGEDKWIGQEEMHLLQACYWRGNVRELRNTVERMVLTNESSKINVSPYITLDTSPTYVEKRIKEPYGKKSQLDGSLADQFEKELREKILKELHNANGNKSHVAKKLGISRGKLYKLLKS